nr:hypothetical protein BaRGS_017139 [Batillaria attramentaria]
MIGVVMFAFYADCHPISFGLVTKTDQWQSQVNIFVRLSVRLSVRVSVCLSLSSGLNALSAVTFKDLIQGNHCCQSVSEFRSTIYSKLIVLGYGLLAVGLAWVVSQLGAVLQAVYVVFGILNGPVLGVMTLGMFFPWANKWGALSGVLGSLVFLLWVGMGAFANEVKTSLTYTLTTACNWTAKPTDPPPTLAPNMTTMAAIATESPAGVLEPLYRMSYMWYTGLGMVLVWGIGLIVSGITGFTKPTSLDPRLVCPIFDKVFPYLPEKILKPLRFGIVHKGGSVSQNGKALEEKQADDASNGYVQPTFQLEDETPEVTIEMAHGKENKAYSAEDQAQNGVVKTRL